MTFHIITLFPEMFAGVFESSILARAQDKKLLKINFINPRDFALDKHQSVDDKPYGGGRGMILRVDVLVAALESIKPKPYTILLEPSGKTYNQKMAAQLAKKKSLAIICGHYEGTDARIRDFVDEVASIGDFILTGGEIAAMALVDSITRLIPGSIHKDSLKSESFSQIGQGKLDIGHWTLARPPKSRRRGEIGNLLEYPQYTRPPAFRGKKVPKVLLSGNHQEIEKWRQTQSQKLTTKLRPDLLSKPKK